MNSYNFIGFLGRDAETRQTPNGDAITSFAVAVKSGYGEKAVTIWINCNLWGKRGESLAPYLLKGAQVAVSGEFTLREYTNKDGEKKVSPDVRVNDVTLIGKREVQETKPAAKEPSGSFDDMEDDIPF